MAVIEELEAKVKENNNKDVAQDKIKELEVLMQKSIRFLVVIVSVVIALAAVLTNLYVARVIIPTVQILHSWILEIICSILFMDLVINVLNIIHGS
jgi:hypothetical protein